MEEDTDPEDGDASGEMHAGMRDDWERLSPLSERLPLRFPSGPTFQTLGCRCAGCMEEIPDGEIHGTVARPTPDLANVEALALCPACGDITKMSFRVRGREFLSVEWFQPSIGWVTRGNGEGAMSRLSRFARAMLGRQPAPVTAGLPSAAAAGRRDPAVNDVIATGWLGALDAELYQRGVRGMSPMPPVDGSAHFSLEGGGVLRVSPHALGDRPGTTASGDMGPLSWDISTG